ncbi:MAG: hypothetical protein ABEK10_02635 [Candidatus Nanosalina sp.]
MGKSDEEIVEEVISRNREGLERLGREEPAEEMRSRLKRLKSRIYRFLKREEDVGAISV